MHNKTSLIQHEHCVIHTAPLITSVSYSLAPRSQNISGKQTNYMTADVFFLCAVRPSTSMVLTVSVG